jgi:hypothetical protein
VEIFHFKATLPVQSGCRRSGVTSHRYGLSRFATSLLRKCGFLTRLGVVISALLAAPVSLALTQPGSITGEFKVTPEGAATYHVPIDVPPGIGEVIPSLALRYNSNGHNSIVGKGWYLQGLSKIHRCGSAESIHDDYRGIDYQNDYYCLDGKHLIPVSGSNGSDGTIYHPYKQPLQKVISHGSAGNGPESFTVWAQNGLVLQYGATTDSRIEVQGRVDVRVWAINQIRDRSSNFVNVAYFEDNHHGEYFPLRFDYTGNQNQNVDPTNHVLLRYENRPDPQYMCQMGALSQTTQRLRSIETYAENAMVSTYSLDYLDNASPAEAIRIEPDSCDPNGEYSLVPENLQARYSALESQIQYPGRLPR